MCGIVGFAKKDCVKEIYNGLKRLEYRGYDSVGVAYFNGELKTIKKKGRIENLPLPEVCDFGIGHTRWATHGEPSDVNAHPHTSMHFALVHNGIVENYSEIKKFLINEGFDFSSTTDTEVIVKYMEYLYKGDVLECFKGLSALKGSYALAVLNSDYPDRIFLAKKENPLIIGKCEGYYCFASDSPAIIEYTDKIYKMKDGEVAVVKNDEVELYQDGKRKKITFTKTKLQVSQIDVGGYSSYMQKEIAEEPLAIKATVEKLYAKGLSKESLSAIKSSNSVDLVGCGSAYNACLYAKYLLEEKVGFSVCCETSGEYRYKKKAPASLVIAVTQSGETSDTIGAVKRAKEKGSYVIAVTNVPDSDVTQHADDSLITSAGAEIAVAATKSYATQLVALRYLAEEIARAHGKKLPAMNARKLYLSAKTLVDNYAEVEKYAQYDYGNLFFIGRSVDYSSALEGALKAKEIAYVPSDACPAAEIKHGPLAIVDENTLVVCISTVKRLSQKCRNAISEVQTRGAKVLVISPYDLSTDERIYLDGISEDLYPILSAIPLQQLALALTLKKGLDPDKPRHLAKSVTVE
ncbi:MAG: glutamine--fructose-6-phosphate transaminase (isomerizing) [Clostridia bacterium]|nr:glutamine--fructose-6-phosphate transaminase (isomerizing) [Clostridia bacterium]